MDDFDSLRLGGMVARDVSGFPIAEEPFECVLHTARPPVVHEDAGDVWTGDDPAIRVLEQFLLRNGHAQFGETRDNFPVPLVPPRTDLVEKRIQARGGGIDTQPQKMELGIARSRLNGEFHAREAQTGLTSARRKETRTALAVVVVRQGKGRETAPPLRQFLRRTGSIRTRAMAM